MFKPLNVIKGVQMAQCKAEVIYRWDKDVVVLHTNQYYLTCDGRHLYNKIAMICKLGSHYCSPHYYNKIAKALMVCQ